MSAVQRSLASSVSESTTTKRIKLTFAQCVVKPLEPKVLAICTKGPTGGTKDIRVERAGKPS